MHLVIYFSGTREGQDPYYSYLMSFGGQKDFNYLYDNENVAALLVHGCQHKDICDDRIFPNLAAFAKRLVGKLFTLSDKEILTLNSSHVDESNTIGIATGFWSKTALSNPAITSITLCGYSRGAATCFNVARELNQIAPSIPVSIVANQPVPGSLYVGPGTNAGSIIDCSDLTNLKNVAIILGTSTSDPKETDLKHRAFYNQIVPKLPRSTRVKREIIVIPRQNHYGSREEALQNNIPFGEKHLHMQVAKYLHECGVVTQEVVNEKVGSARATYTGAEYAHSGEKKVTPNFPRFDKLQTFFGIASHQLSRYKDPLHPTPYLSEGYELTQNELLIDWWNKHDQESSFFMSDLTKSLIESIQSINNNPEMLVHLFRTVETWLILKADSKSSRYNLVTALRNNLYHQLITSHHVEHNQLNAISHRLHHEKRYFQEHWRTLSTAASFWKTEATERLDLAFQSHVDNILSKENDEALLAALNNWLQEKEGSSSKRWDIVLEMKEILEEAIKTSYLDMNNTSF